MVQNNGGMLLLPSVANQADCFWAILKLQLHVFEFIMCFHHFNLILSINWMIVTFI